MKFREKSTSKFYAFAMAAVFALVLAGCGGGGGGTAAGPDPEPTPMPTPYETALEAITAADTPEAAQAAYDAVKDDVTATAGEMLQAAVDARVAELAKMDRVQEQKMALMTAAGMVDTSDLSTQEAVDAAREAIVALREALDAADDVSDADKAMYMSQLDDAVAAVDEAQGGIDTATRRTNQMEALTSASGTLQAALAALSGQTPTKAQLDAANMALTALSDALMGAEDLTDTEKAPYQREADNAAAPIRTAQAAFDDAEEAAENARNMAMMATAMKLHAGISAPGGTGDTTRTAAYDTTDDSMIAVTIGSVAAVNLSEDEDMPLAARGEWAGMIFTAEPEGEAGTYEAHVYSHIGDPTVTEGAAFSTAYTLTDGETGDVTALTGHATSRVASPSFDQSAGTKEFEKGDNQERVMIAGSYQGVSGTYYCTPTNATTNCRATVADMGFTLMGGTWSFKPSNPAQKLMDTSAADESYASYGWWLHKSEDGSTYTASAFHDYRGTDAGTVAIADLRGTAIYTGGAAGKYALHSTTGGMNDAGHFTADVSLTATFAEDHTIEGTVSNFVGGDGEARDWSVALNSSTVADAGAIAGDPEDSTDTGPQMTVWTIGGNAADAAGQWSGDLREEGDDGVPGIATGTFYAEFGRDGKMVGAFGANK
ncbi:MAG: hypothetical protein F4X91_16010 [Nitrospinae bacterium]|nr:hypothetical protein [Nitrospinota bacterium]